MIDLFLQSRLRPVVRRACRLRWWSLLALCWLGVALLAWGGHALLAWLGFGSRWLWPVVGGLGALAALTLGAWARRRPDDWHAAALRVEQCHPELEGRLLTAVEQPLADAAAPGFLSRRLIDEAMDHSHTHRWARAITLWRLATAQAAHLLALVLVGWLFVALPPLKPRPPETSLARGAVEVSPGDTALERGESLVVMARFGEPVPAAVELVRNPGTSAEARTPLVRSLDDPIFGGSVPDLQTDLIYRLEFGGRRTRDFRVTVFERPRLVRADAVLHYPDYTGQPERRIEQTRRVSAVEGSRVDWELQLNVPVARARLVGVASDDPGRPPQVIELTPTAEAPAARLTNHVLRTSGIFRLELADAAGRTNANPARFGFLVLTNRLPELRLTMPRGDLRPSPIEEVAFAGTVWDDFGVEAYGVGYTPPGGPTRYLELGKAVPARERRPFAHVLRLEDLGLAPAQLFTWFVWADDRGPDGAPRRTTSDLFFAEIRPFEEIFREAANQPASSSSSSDPQQQQQRQSPARRLAELQKQILTATWKLQREASTAGADEAGLARGNYPADAEVVRDAQSTALSQAEEAASSGDAGGSRGAATVWPTVIEQMTRARDVLTRALDSPGPLPAALQAEQAAYQALLRAQERDVRVSRQRGRGQGQSPGSRSRMRQRQLDQLDLTKQADRYETERQAAAPRSEAQREQLQVLNRLRELARRQADVNQRLRELQAALHQAPDETEKERLRRELKRLRDSEQRLLADLDELRQRLDQPENQSRLADQQARLEQTREDLRRAAEAAGEGQASRALAAGARAQRQMQEMRDELRRNSASAFAEDLRQMRAQARELGREEEQLRRRLAGEGEPRPNRLSGDDSRDALLEQTDRQRARLTNLVERIETVSELSEQAEPLVSRTLYDTLRGFTQEEAGAVREFREDLLSRGLMTRSLYDRLQQAEESERARSLMLVSEMLRRGLNEHAAEAERRAGQGIDRLREGVERAAQQVLGDDTEALRLARNELDALTDALRREGPGASAQPEPADRPGGQSPVNRSAQPAGNNGRNQDNPTGSQQPGAQPSGRGERPTQPARQGGGGQRPDQNQRPPTGESARTAQADRPGQPGDRQRGPGGGGRGEERTGAPANAERQQRTAEALRRALEAASRLAAGEQGGGGRAGADGGFRGDRWGTGPGGRGPLTGPDFADWADRLREVEELVDLPDWRSRVARARERAGELRRDYREERKKPDWAVVELEVLRPLVEVRDLVAEELARRNPGDQLAPVDRDPVPARYAELVRRYYERLGKERTP